MRTINQEEAHDRYYAAKKEAETELLSYSHALTTEADVIDRLEIAFLWRMFLEGNEITEMTMEMMLEATNP